MKYFIVPVVLAIVGVLVASFAIHYYIEDSIYVRNNQESNQYLIPNITYFILSGSWLVLGIYLAILVFVQLYR